MGKVTKASYEDIPKLTRTGSYHVNIGLGYLERYLEEQIKDGLDIDPPFQRAHVWTEDQQIAYVEYILKCGKSSRDILCNCPEWQGGRTANYVLVDGKQRLNAIIRYLHNEIRAFGRYRDEYDDVGIRSVQYDIIWHVNDLPDMKSVYKWYLELNAGGVVHTKAELDKVRKMLEMEENK